MSSPTTILLVDDHPMIRDALKLYFNDINEVEVKGEANNGSEALEKLESESFDLVITDVNMPEMNGVEFMQALKEKYADQNVLVVSMINEAAQIKKMISLGANGYVLKNSPKDEILTAIKSIVGGENYFGKEVYSLIMENISGKKPKQRLTLEIPLTKREKEILKLVMEEFTNQEISEKLFISVRTVEAHKRNLLEKTGSKTVAGLAIYAMERNLI
ncbi:MAG: response regulator transcription factor [bacterium]|nr:response regulator transcription factor [bacterium]